MNDDTMPFLRRGVNERSNRNSGLDSPGSCIVRYSGLAGLPDGGNVVLRPPLLPRTGSLVPGVAFGVSGVGVMSQMSCLLKYCTGSVMWYSVYCSVCARNMSSG